MRRFNETLNYLDVLYRVIFSPEFKLNRDFGKSFSSITDQVELLRKLDYSKLLEESFDPIIKPFLLDGGGILRDDTVLLNYDWKNIFTDSTEDIKSIMLNLTGQFKRGAFKLNEGGYWEQQELKNYCAQLSNFVELVCHRLDEFRKLHADLLKETDSKIFPGISEKLSSWIKKSVTDKVLEEIILNKRLPDGVKKLVWIGGPTDAYRFSEWCNMNYSSGFEMIFEAQKFKKPKGNNRPTPNSKPRGDSIHYVLKELPFPKKK